MNPIQIALGLVLAAALIFIAPLVGICVGAFAGWVVGMFFPGTVGLVGSAISGGGDPPGLAGRRDPRLRRGLLQDPRLVLEQLTEGAGGLPPPAHSAA